jgi:dienelactone hydrolase
VKVARWLAERGIAAFVLKYRTLQTQGEERPPAPTAVATARRKEVVIHNANANPEPDNLALREVLAMAVTDAQAAMRLVRAHAGEWHIDPHRIGLMGFSAGGGVAVATALAPASDGSPDFLASLYGPSLQDVHVRSDSPPLFIGVGSQHFNVTSGCNALFDAWRAAARPTELHVYEGVSAGFGFNARGLPVDGWKDRFLEWMAAQGLLHPAAQATTAKTH